MTAKTEVTATTCPVSGMRLSQRMPHELIECPMCSTELLLGLRSIAPLHDRPAPTACYSDHNEDIRTKGSCDYCGDNERDAIRQHRELPQGVWREHDAIQIGRLLVTIPDGAPRCGIHGERIKNKRCASCDALRSEVGEEA